MSPQYITKFDGIPGFWNYLADLNQDDLIAELIQNDLDQGATQTIISFERKRLVCEGNGEPVGTEGWQRLKRMLGAGHEVPAKRSRFGVKNHGLKTAFTIGDEICLMSSGHRIHQTLYANGRNTSPYPGASERPIEDSQAPTEGCHIIVRYRNTDLETSQGEAIKLGAMDAEKIEKLFRSACASIPGQFAGIVSPEVTPRYEIVLRHWKLGDVRFSFSCTRPRKSSKRIEIFRRECTVKGTCSPLPNPLREQAVRRLVPLTGILRDRVANFFRRGRRFFIEVSWPIDGKGKPKTGTGRYRYPIGYPENSVEARTGHGTHFNAPFASDNKRHAPARQETTNIELRKACEELLIDAIAHYTIPRWKADGLNLIVPSVETDGGSEVVRALLEKLVSKGALPVLNWREAGLATKGRRNGLKTVVYRPVVRGAPKNERRYRFVVPSLTWSGSTVDPLLSLLCPSSEMQLDPRVHANIVCLLTDRKTPGFCEEFVTFDENDVIDRVSSQGNQYFGPIMNPEREFSQPQIVRTYLDLIKSALDGGEIETEKEEAVLSTLLLPDTSGQATSMSDIYSNASLPSDIPDLELPPILDRSLAAHALFKRKKWRIRKFTMAEFLKGSALRAANEKTRRMFWKWLSRNGQKISPRDRPKLAELVIWPDENDNLSRLSDLCEPRSRHVGAILAGFIRRPHSEIRRSKLISIGGKARTSIRRRPTEDEVRAWLDTQLAQFEPGSQTDIETADELRRFERHVSILLKDKSVAPLLKAVASALPAIARDGTIRLRTKLVLPNRDNDRLALPDRFLLADRQHAAMLDKLSPALNAPTAGMLLDAFDEDADNSSALQSRLRKFKSITETDDDERRELSRKPIILVGTRLRAPCELAFPSNKGDYWGDWKIVIPTDGLSQNAQSLYRSAGVTSAIPRPETSRAFFEWLGAQDQTVLGQHIPCVLRHFLEQYGPVNWGPVFTEIPCIPAKGQNGLRLVSVQFAKQNRVFLSEEGDIGDTVIKRDSSVLLVIDQAKEVSSPISEPLRELGVKSLRNRLGEPENVVGAGGISPVSKDILDHFDRLKSPRFRRTFKKRLGKLGVELELVRRDWQKRLDDVQDIKFGEEVELCYRLYRKRYREKADAGFDASTGILWIKQDLGTRELYESVARQFIFKPMARPIDLLALERAVEMEISEQSFGSSRSSQSDSDDDGMAAEGTEGSGQDDEANGKLGEAGSGHSPFEPDPVRNRPKPGPIAESADRPQRSKGQSMSSEHGQGSSSPRQTPDLEKQHIQALKRDHYASHCQMCLCERPPQELAPTGSYIESEEVRQRVVEAHHADLVSAGGARHAGNIILLCKLHHENYGKQFTRSGISTALRNNPKRMSIHYDESSHIDGQRIEFTVPDTGEVVKLFFTEHHIKYWLEHSTVPNS